MASDFRAKYSLSIFDINKTYSALEAWLLVQALAGDPTSLYGARKNHMKWPMSAETRATAAVYDLLLNVNSKPGTHRNYYPLPYEDSESNEVEVLGAGAIDKELARKLFRIMNPALEDPAPGESE